MPNRIRIRRERPSALSWALALAVTMLAVYLLTLNAPPEASPAPETPPSDRTTAEVAFDAVRMHFASLGRFDDAAKARIAAAQLARRGAAGRLYAHTDGVHVLGAAYESEADAGRVAGQLGGSEGLSASVLSLEAEAVTLRITAPEKDVRAIADAGKILRMQLNQAGDLALRLDRGELSPASAQTLADVSASELRAARTALATVDGAAENPVCAGLMALLDSLAEGFSRAARCESATTLPGLLRLCHVDGLLRLIGFQRGLCGE